MFNLIITYLFSVGQCGNQIGCRFWDLALREYANVNKVGGNFRTIFLFTNLLLVALKIKSFLLSLLNEVYYSLKIFYFHNRMVSMMNPLAVSSVMLTADKKILLIYPWVKEKGKLSL